MMWGKKQSTGNRKNVRRKPSKVKNVPKSSTKRATKRTTPSRRRKTGNEQSTGVITSIKNVLFSRLLKWTVTLAVLATALGFAGHASYILLNQPLENIRLHADLERVTPLEVEAVLSEYKQTGFLELPLNDIKNSLEALPWVDRAEVKRQWSNWLVVTLNEQVAVARWGKSGLLNSRGELIMRNAQARYLPPELPQLDGPEKSEWRVAQRYLELHTLLKQHGLYLTHLQQDARGAWQFTLSNGMQVELGKHSTDERLRRFANSVLPKMLNYERVAAVIDLRYGNGFSVKWRDQDVIPPQQLIDPELTTPESTTSTTTKQKMNLQTFSIMTQVDTQGRHYG